MTSVLLRITKEIRVSRFIFDGVVCLGSIILNKSRLLWVQLANLNQKRKFLLSNTKRLWSSSTSMFQELYITPDLSVKQTVIQKQLRAELRGEWRI